MYLQHVNWIGTACLLVVWASQAVAAEKVAESAKEPRPAPTAAQITGWIAKLDDDRYQAREEATQHLFEAGGAALDPLLAAANADRPEPSDRSVWILRRFSTSKDAALRRKALGHLASLTKRPQVAAASAGQSCPSDDLAVSWEDPSSPYTTGAHYAPVGPRPEGNVCPVQAAGE